MKTKLLLGVTLVCAIVAVAYGIWSHQRNQELSYELCRDVVRALIELHRFQASASGVSSNHFEHAYGFQQHVANAKEIGVRWEADRSPDRRLIVDTLLGALTHFDEAATTLVELNKRPDEQKLGLFKVKLEEGRARLIDTSAVLVSHQSILNKKGKSDIIGYINSVFEKELAAYEVSKKKGEDPNLSEEIWAAIIIKQKLTHEN